MKTQNVDTVKQHYVPRFYLEQFIGKDGFIWGWNIEKKKRFPTQPSDICFINNYYEAELNNSNSESKKFLLYNEIEKTLSKMESKYSTIYKLVLNICSDKENKNIPVLRKDERTILGRFFTNMFLRNPNTLDLLWDEKEFNDLRKNDEFDAICELFNKLNIGNYEAISKLAFFKGVLTDFDSRTYYNHISKDMLDLKIVFLVSHLGGFITTDFPANLGVDNSILTQNKKSGYFPLSPKVAVLYGDYDGIKSNRIMNVDLDSVAELNEKYLNSISGKYKYILSNDVKVLQKAVGVID